MYQESLLSRNTPANVPAIANKEDQLPQRRVFLIYENQRWLKVPMSIVDRIGIEHQISKRSYRDDRCAYLHEAQDVNTLMTACVYKGCYPFTWSPALILPWPEVHYRLVIRPWFQESA